MRAAKIELPRRSVPSLELRKLGESAGLPPHRMLGCQILPDNPGKRPARLKRRR